MRSIGLSNTILVVTSVPDNCAAEFAEDTVVIRDQLNEVIELIPAVAKLQKLSVLIGDRQYDEGNEEEVEGHGVVRTLSHPCLPFLSFFFFFFSQQVRFTYDEAKFEIQASDAELDKGLKDRRILIINSQPLFLSSKPRLMFSLNRRATSNSSRLSEPTTRIDFESSCVVVDETHISIGGKAFFCFGRKP